MAQKKARTPTPPRRVQAPQKRTQAPSRRPTTQASAGDRRRLWLIGGAVAALAVLAVVLGLVLTGGSKGATPVVWSSLTGLQTGPPPWNTGIDTAAERLDQIGLNPLPQEAVNLHIHAHLDIFWNGKKATVPPGVGIEPPDQSGQGGYFLELHTHDTRGVVHVEAPSKKDFTIAQFMAAWGVRLTSNCLSSRCGDVKIYVDGKRFTQDPNKLVLKSHQEIAVVAGKAPKTIPSKYKGFFAGE